MSQNIRKLSRYWLVNMFLVGVMTLLLFNNAYAYLIVRGEDSLGNKLIFDTDFNITWYDYTHDPADWGSQLGWASSLSVDFVGNIYDDWRLPTSLNQDGSGPSSGFNVSSSEMGHLYYAELGNIAGNGGYSNSGVFSDLQKGTYWTSTPYAQFTTYIFSLGDKAFPDGYQWTFGNGNKLYGIAVREGDVSAVPLTGTAYLLASGLLMLVGIKRKKIC